MASKTYKTSGIVLRKTKLGEKDLIVSILDESGALVRAVAKGARKPGGSYAAKLELFSVVDLMLAQGKNLDVIIATAKDMTIGRILENIIRNNIDNMVDIVTDVDCGGLFAGARKKLLNIDTSYSDWE